MHTADFTRLAGDAEPQEEDTPGHHHHHVRGQRQYEFAVEVTAGPPNSVFRHTKVITVKSKYIVENQTGMPIEIKQRGTPDLDVLQYGSTAHGRCARRLEVNERCASLCHTIPPQALLSYMPPHAQVVHCTPSTQCVTWRNIQPHSWF